MRPALRLVSIISGIFAIVCLFAMFDYGFPQGFVWLVAFGGAAVNAIVFEAGSELLSVLYQIRDRLPEPTAKTEPSPNP